MSLNPEALYLQLSQLVAEMPELEGSGTIALEVNRWLGRAAQLVEATGDKADATILAIAANNLNNLIREQNAQTVRAIVCRALAKAEANAPTALRGGFVGVGAALDALQVVGKALGAATRDVLIVDAYMDSKVFTDFAPTASQGVAVRLLADSYSTKPDAVAPALSRWRQQYGTARPIDVRLSPARALHDRLIAVDGTLVWSMTQSLKDFAGRSPALVQRVDPDLAKPKLAFYEQVWTTSSQVP